MPRSHHIRIQLFDKGLAPKSAAHGDPISRKTLSDNGYALNEETDHWAEAVVDVGDPPIISKEDVKTFFLILLLDIPKELDASPVNLPDSNHPEALRW